MRAARRYARQNLDLLNQNSTAQSGVVNAQYLSSPGTPSLERENST
jgi:hypothetical protein